MRDGVRGRAWVLVICVVAACGPATELQDFDVDSFREALMVAYGARDVEALAALHAADVSVVNSRGESIEGRAAFAEYWRSRWEGATGPNPLEYTPTEVRRAGSFAIERGEYGPQGAPTIGRYVWFLAPQPSNAVGWEIQWFIYSS